MTALDLEAEYNNRARVPEHPAIIAKWKSDAEAFRMAHQNAELGERYGWGERQKIDIFWPDDSRSGRLILFIHGGYWQALDRSYFSHLAHGANANGVAFALCGYDLCPEVSLGAIIGQVRAAALHLWKSRRRSFVACGHSAGGHLTACLLTTDWDAAGAPANFVSSGLSISGLFDLEPLVPTTINAALKLDREAAWRYSPLHQPLHGKRTLDAWVGAWESSEYLRQSRAITDEWKEKGAETAYREIAGANHFTVLDPLTDPSSEISQRLASFAHALR